MSLHHLPDEQLLVLFADSRTKTAAFEAIVRKYSPRLYSVVRRYVRDHDDADDVLQNTWVRVWEKLGTYKGESQLFTWLYRVTSNEALQHIGREGKRTSVSLSEEGTEVAGGGFTPGPDTAEIERKLAAALAELPEKQRVVFELRYYDEMPYEEMSKMLDTSVGALKASYHHAVKKIEAFLRKAD